MLTKRYLTKHPRKNLKEGSLMKKIVLSAAIAAVCAAPLAAMADTNLYGQMRYSFNSVDDVDGAGQDGMSGNDNVSLFGLKGSAGDDVKAFYHLQTGAPSDNNAGQAFNQRFYFGGLSGGFGKVAYGRMTNAYKFAGFKLDPFYNMSHINVKGSFATGGGTYGLSPATNGFTDNALQYTSPAFSGVKVNLGVYIDDSDQDDHGTNAGISWSSDGINLGVQYASNAKNAATIPGLVKDGDAVRVHGGYKAKGWSVGFSYETVDENVAAVAPSPAVTVFDTTAGADITLTPAVAGSAGSTGSTNYMYLVGRYNVTEKTEAILSIGTVDPDKGAANAGAEGTGMTFGLFQTVAPKTQVYATFSQADLDAQGVEDPSVFSIGAIHKFGFGG
jgi:predicted porin